MGTIVEARGGVETVVDGVDGVAVVVETEEMDLGKSICLFPRSKSMSPCKYDTHNSKPD
jgi:hypothetical protein